MIAARTMDPVACYDALAEAFRRSWYMMAPGKDAPLSMSQPPHEERRAAWEAWKAALGPSDRAACIALEMWRNER